MPEVPIDQQRASRWKGLALISLAALILTLAGWAAHSTAQSRALSDARAQAEKAKEDAERAERERKAAEKNVERERQKAEFVQYANRLREAQQALERNWPEKDKR